VRRARLCAWYRTTGTRPLYLALCWIWDLGSAHLGSAVLQGTLRIYMYASGGGCGLQNSCYEPHDGGKKIVFFVFFSLKCLKVYLKKCIAHGGGRRCTEQGCTKHHGNSALKCFSHAQYCGAVDCKKKLLSRWQTA
jgi:hypothetical protein